MIEQYGALCYRDGDAGLDLLLITSRETRRWVIPRGNAIAGLSPPEAAAQEAYEEAGVRGEVGSRPLGSYDYSKKRRDGSVVPARVGVFPLRVTEQSPDWPEKHQRELRWFAPEAAAAAVEEPELKAIILSFKSPASG